MIDTQFDVTEHVWSSAILEQKYFKDKTNKVFCIDILASNVDSWENEKGVDWDEISQELALKLVTPPDNYHYFNEVSQEWETNDELQAAKLENWRQGVMDLTPKQLRLVLLENGFNSSKVEAAITQIEDEMVKETALIEWQFGTSFQRTNPNLVLIATQLLGFNDSQIDEMWKHALTL
ncbi:hypothetical protein LVJ82_17325 [Vitreoscilla massiliensis]|uniref:DUF4376 domain-containing protein n=1 Tax=Vitreoscilla massiliensis TaxID=1689272 RepID=A0ABY4E072_9NEIS|nr:hypothetical protein [Vitreoscilla massiliensis]UOO89182.1 hypothetical protein LVJ82_17325 [Vitreoscilla massiliensis]